MERIAAVVFSALALLSGSVAQEAQDVAKPLQYEVSVVLKLIHVYVVDAKGKPVEGLTRDDFVVTDNGRPVSVTAFERHLLASPPRPEEKSGPVPVIPAASPPPPAAAGRKFFLFFDLAFNNARGLTKAKTAALHFLDAEARPEDEIGVLSYSMFKGVSVREFLTADHGKVRKVLESIDQRGISGRASEIEDWYWQLVQEPLPGGQGEAGGLSAAQSQQYMKEAEAQRQESKRIAQVYILRLTDLAKALRYVPGQKHFILFSSGVPASLIYGSQAGNPNSVSGRGAFDPGDRTIRTQNEDMVKEFAASGCTFYAFDTRESAMVVDLFAYDRETFEIGSRGLGNTQSVFQDSMSVFRDDKTTGLNSLKRLTDITGGKYFSNINRYQRNLDQVQNLTGTFYVLGYSIGQQWDGQFHEVKVECRRKGCEVRAQTGYFNPKPFKELTPLERELQLFDLALNGRSDLYLPKIVPLAPLSYDAGEGMVLRTVSRIPRGALEGSAGKNVELVSLVFDDQDNVVALQRRTADLSQYGRDGFIFSSGLAAKPGAYKCRLVVRDLDTGKCAVGSTKAFVPGPSPGFAPLRGGRAVR